jgi:hypothetical protein
MDRLPAHQDVDGETLRGNSPAFDGASQHEIATQDGSLSQLDRVHAVVDRCEFPRDERRGVAPTDLLTLKDRDDIDAAVLDALRHATVSGHGFPVLGWTAPDRDRSTGARRFAPDASEAESAGA